MRGMKGAGAETVMVSLRLCFGAANLLSCRTWRTRMPPLSV